MNPFIQQLLRQAGSRIIPKAVRSVQGFADDLAAPVLRGVGTLTENALVKSAGAIRDAVVRPSDRFIQKSLANPVLGGSPRTFRPGLSGQVQVMQQTGGFAPYIPLPESFNHPRYLDGAQRFLKEFGGNVTSSAQRAATSLAPGPTSVQFPFDDSLELLKGKAKYLQRQAQAGINTSQGVFRNLQSFGPTALNPLATRNPTTFLGQVGKSLNPLNPVNLGVGIATNVLLPESMRGTANIGLLTPGPIPFKVLSAGLYDTFLNPENAGVGLATGTLRDNDPMRYGYAQHLAEILKKQNDKSQINNNSLNALRQSGQNYIVNGIEYDYKTGRALNPPTNAFVPVRQDNEIDRSYPRDPAERSYQGELQRTAQLTAQNPELKRYEADRVKAKTQEERNAVRDMGLAIWQKEYGQKQIGKPGGAIGTFNPLMSTGNTTQTTGDQLVVPINTDEVPYQVGDFSRATLDSGYDLNAFGITPEMIEELQKRLLLQGIK